MADAAPPLLALPAGLEVALLPLDLARWDQAAGGDLFAVPVPTDVRPLRGAAGLLDWRLNGRLSSCLREERFQGTCGEKLLIPTSRIPWRAVLAVGVGPAGEVDDERCRTALAVVLATARGLGQTRLALALPGREGGRLPLERAVILLAETLAAAARDGAGAAERAGAGGVTALTLVDTAAALKPLGEKLGLSAGPRALAGPG
jgi:hypothetical protein